MALVGFELETLVSEPDALTTRPPPCALSNRLVYMKISENQISSSFFPITVSISQGSVLGPILFFCVYKRFAEFMRF